MRPNDDHEGQAPAGAIETLGRKEGDVGQEGECTGERSSGSSFR